MAVAGTVTAVLDVSSDAKDTDFAAKLIDVDSAGRSWNVVSGILRARYRESMGKPVFMAPATGSGSGSPGASFPSTIAI